jgi:hypothetical protein
MGDRRLAPDRTGRISRADDDEGTMFPADLIFLRPRRISSWRHDDARKANRLLER